MVFRRFEPLGDALIPLDTHGPFEAEFGSAQPVRMYVSSPISPKDRVQSIAGSLRQAQYQFNKIRYKQATKEKQMFNEDELKFIKETAEKDLCEVKSREEYITNELARLGKNLGEVKVVKSRLQNILQGIIDDEKKKLDQLNRLAQVSSYASNPYNLSRCC